MIYENAHCTSAPWTASKPERTSTFRGCAAKKNTIPGSLHKEGLGWNLL